jgi:hypothetical protein
MVRLSINCATLPGKESAPMSDTSGGRGFRVQGIVDGSGHIGGDPTVREARLAADGTKTGGKKKAGRGSVPDFTWEQRALRLLTALEAAKGYKDLPLKLKAEVRSLIEGAPDGAYS